MKNRVLVTGATGFIGSCLTHRLVNTNYDIHIIKRETSNIWRIKDILNRVTVHNVDLTDKKNLEKIVKAIKPDIILHLANAGVYGGWHLPERQLIETNFLGTVNLINACNNIKYKCFINTGSSSEYGLKKDSMKETDICEPINIYGITKCAATLYCQAKARREKLPIVTLRLFSPYGYYDEPTRLVPSVIKSCLLGENPKVSSPRFVRDFIFIEDVIDAYLKTTPQMGGEIFNIGYGQQHTVGEVVNTIVKLTGNKVRPEWGSSSMRPSEPTMWQANITKAKNFLNWRPQYTLKEGLEKTVKWYETR